MGLIPITAVLLLAITSIESSYYYYTSPNLYYTPHSPSIASSYIRSPYAYYASRLSQPIYYIRHISRAAPVRKFARSFKVQGQGASTTIVLNDTMAVPFTVSKSALSTAKYEKNPDDSGEEGVGPAIEVEAPASASRLSPRSKVPSITSKGATAGKESKGKSKVKSGVKISFEPEVVYSDVHPIYVKPPNDFRPIVYPNRRLDGVRYTNKLSNQVPLSPVPPPFPFGYPRGLSSWSLGGPKAISRGNYWESLSSDEALNLQPEANTIHPSTSSPTASNFNGRSKFSHSQRPLSLPPFLPWFMVPSTSSLYSYEVQYPASPASSITVMPLTHPRPLPHVASPKPGPDALKEKKIAVRNKTESAEGIRTKLPVGLSSWMLGGVRDLTGKHWKMPDLFVDNVSVVEIENNATKDSSGHKNETDMDTMMTSDGEYEKVVPVVSVPESEREAEEENSPRDSGVVFDDDPDFLNANNNIPIS